MNLTLYVRTNMDKNPNVKGSIQYQLNNANDWCKQHNHKLVEIFLDERFSGLSKVGPRYIELMKRIEAQDYNFKGIVVNSLSRISRNNDTLFQTIKKFKINNLSLFSISNTPNKIQSVLSMTSRSR